MNRANPGLNEFNPFRIEEWIFFGKPLIGTAGVLGSGHDGSLGQRALEPAPPRVVLTSCDCQKFMPMCILSSLPIQRPFTNVILHIHDKNT
jgi:hypothetical protein